MNKMGERKENEFLEHYPDVFQMLLYDHTTRKNIIWATESYIDKGEGYLPHDEITIPKITGNKTLLLRPRALKSREEQSERSRDMAEVSTPTWLCNEQNNLVDEAWFERKNVFNRPYTRRGKHFWQTTKENILFQTDKKDKTWQRYVSENILEVSCGEAPYLVSRYDSVSGHPIPLHRRIGLLDRKLRVVSENTTTSHWLRKAQKAFMSTYGFEWQGDNLLLARRALFFSFIDYFVNKFGKMPKEASMKYIAYIISWNIWQMDGLKGVVPESCQNNTILKTKGLFGEQEEVSYCVGCETNNLRKHNGIYCLIRDWGHKDPITQENNRKIRFIDIIK